MPFTFAHPLAVLPLGIRKNKCFDFTALIIGSMAPDFEYFIHFRPYQLYGHTIFGQLYFNLPLVIIISLIYHYILKDAIIINLPKPYCEYYYYLTKKRWRINSIRRAIIVAYSSLLGMFTHLFWDSFTHRAGYFVTKIVTLSDSISFANYDIPIYKILQHGSSVIGLSIILVAVFKIQDRNCQYNFSKVSKAVKAMFWVNAIIMDFIVVTVVLVLTKDFSVGRVVVSFISGGFIGLCTASLIAYYLNHHR